MARRPSLLQTFRFTCISSPIGSVPLAKYSVRDGNPSCAILPDILSTSAVTTPSGLVNSTGSKPFKLSSNILLHIGDAPETPDATLSIGELSLFPTQTPTDLCGLPPIVQLSLLSFVVPVLTAICLPETFNNEFGPNASVRAELSDKIFEIIYASSGLNTFLPFLGVISSKTFPSLSSTFNIAKLSAFVPPLKNTE